MTYNDILQKIIDLIKANANFATVRAYHFGRPEKFPSNALPCICVEFQGGAVASRGIGGYLKRKDHNYTVTVVHKSGKPDTAEKYVAQKAEQLETLFKSDRTHRTLGGLVSIANVIDVSKVEDPSDPFLKQVRVTLKTMKEA